jgi:hypothetical protein
MRNGGCFSARPTASKRETDRYSTVSYGSVISMMISEVSQWKVYTAGLRPFSSQTQCHDVRKFLQYRFNLPKLESRKSESVSARDSEAPSHCSSARWLRLRLHYGHMFPSFLSTRIIAGVRITDPKERDSGSHTNLRQTKESSAAEEPVRRRMEVTARPQARSRTRESFRSRRDVFSIVYIYVSIRICTVATGRATSRAPGIDNTRAATK